MRLNSKAYLLAASAACIAGFHVPAAWAQDVVFRRPILMSNANDYAWATSPYQPVDVNGNPLNPASLCGEYPVEREATCVNVAGSTVDASFCAGISKPSTTATQNFTAGCTFSWNTSAWVDPGASCTSSETQSRSVTCRSDQTGTVVSDMNCAGAKPASSQTVADYSACTYSWQSGSWVDPGNSCTPSETQSRTVDCQRSDGTTVADSNCSGAKPATSQTVSDYSGCSFGWATSTWTDPNGASCAASETHTRSVTCQRSDGTTVADSNCSGAKPATSQTVADYSGCGYSWQSSAWVDPGASCSANEIQARAVNCLRSDGTVVADANCSGAKPATSQSVADYSGCTYGWQGASWSAWSSTCSDAANRTRAVTCVRSDGTTVADVNCSGAKPASSETSGVYSSCAYNWNSGGWVDPGPSCTDAETQTRSVTCTNSTLGRTEADANCVAAKPATSQSVSDYSDCANQTSVQWGGWNYASTCSTNTTRTRTGTCLVNGVASDPKFCTTYGGKPLSETESVSNLTGCTYSWNTGSWSAWSSTCSSSATRTRTVNCQRSDGTTVADSNCSGAKPATSETTSVTSGCTTCTVASNGYTCVGGTVVGSGDYNYMDDGSAVRDVDATGAGVMTMAHCIALGGNCVQRAGIYHSEYGAWETGQETYTCYKNSTGVSNSNPGGPASSTDWEYYGARRSNNCTISGLSSTSCDLNTSKFGNASWSDMTGLVNSTVYAPAYSSYTVTLNFIDGGAMRTVTKTFTRSTASGTSAYTTGTTTLSGVTYGINVTWTSSSPNYKFVIKLYRNSTAFSPATCPVATPP